MKKIIVTGATSMIGIALIECAVSNNVEVYAIIRPDTKRRDRLPHSDLLHLIECKLTELERIKEIPLDCDVLYHFAWVYTAKNMRDDALLQEENIKITLDCVKLAQRCGCYKFIGAGSQAEYGRVNGIIDGKTKCQPEVAYGVAKYAAGLLSKKLCEDLDMIHIWGRIFSVYGKYDNPDTMLDYAIKSFLHGNYARFSSGKQRWDYLFEQDAGKIFYLLGVRADESKTYRIANGKARCLRNYIAILAQKMHAENLCIFDESCDSQIGIEADISDLVADIGYTPDTSFESGIGIMINEYKQY